VSLSIRAGDAGDGGDSGDSGGGGGGSLDDGIRLFEPST